ncbi:MAG: diguanylate cyclase domain-containing protein, partial [Acetobacteraceae bacterium]
MLRYRRQLRDLLLLLIAMGAATYLAYRYSLFTNASRAALQRRVIDLDEALALIAVFCAGLVILAWRLLLSQRREVARRITAEQHARELAHRDALTGLPNRRQLEDELRSAIESPPGSGGAHAVLLMDLNDFKRINDVYGHGAGDDVLIAVAARLQKAVRTGDLVVRLGGDEFVIIARQLLAADEATTLALRVIGEFSEPILARGERHHVRLAVGIAMIPQDGCEEGEIMRRADIALYRAKGQRNSALCFFEPDMDARIQARDLLERHLRTALAAG